MANHGKVDLHKFCNSFFSGLNTRINTARRRSNVYSKLKCMSFLNAPNLRHVFTCYWMSRLYSQRMPNDNARGSMTALLLSVVGTLLGEYYVDLCLCSHVSECVWTMIPSDLSLQYAVPIPGLSELSIFACRYDGPCLSMVMFPQSYRA
ncbi:hypothetical protein BDQ12DRAFT_690310 [Crucibulum laeve]|uniref:Uncharacterized protein n=1 Tax=Crucibulum laeve TaxID=68775 RepID=A0A5C3LZ41_9AGAR|nr:hypothetical protein BDQ12DRAFT_690310 [Crucibulum laeve]